jgi:hypothetical protein
VSDATYIRITFIRKSKGCIDSGGVGECSIQYVELMPRYVSYYSLIQVRKHSSKVDLDDLYSFGITRLTLKQYPGEPQTDQTGTTFAMILYWVFGGTRLKEDRTPWARLKERTERLFSW